MVEAIFPGKSPGLIAQLVRVSEWNLLFMDSNLTQANLLGNF